MATLPLTPLVSPLRVDDVGVVRIGTSRVTLDSLVVCYRDGSTAEEIVEQFPGLLLADVHAALAYYLTHLTEVDDYLKARRRTADELRRSADRVSDPQGIRDRLLAREAARKPGT